MEKDNSYRAGELYNESGRKVDSDYNGKKYKLIKLTRDTPISKICGYAILTILTLGLCCVISKSIRKALFQGVESNRYGICVNPLIGMTPIKALSYINFASKEHLQYMQESKPLHEMLNSYSVSDEKLQFFDYSLLSSQAIRKMFTLRGKFNLKAFCKLSDKQRLIVAKSIEWDKVAFPSLLDEGASWFSFKKECFNRLPLEQQQSILRNSSFEQPV